MSCPDCNCKGNGANMPTPPWRARRYSLDGPLVVAILRGDAGLVVEHIDLPPDASVMSARQNGTQTEIYVESQTFDLRTCCAGKIPVQRVNYTTGGAPVGDDSKR